MAASSKNVVEETWLAYAFERSTPAERIEAGLARVAAHYGGLIAGPIAHRGQTGERHGLVLWTAEQSGCAWPLWAAEGGLCIAASAVPTGWDRILGPTPPAVAPIRLARALATDPDRLRDLAPPFVIGIRDTDAERLTILNDSLGVGRLYEMRTTEGWVWSNRLGALPIFAGLEARADPRGWALLAAAGWFLGDSTPIRNARKIPPGTAITAEVIGGATAVEQRQSGAQRALVAPRRAALADAAEAAADQVATLARDIDRVWDVPAEIDLTGGRDSRVSAAAAVAGGHRAWFKTSDNEPGELEVVRELIATAPLPMEHVVNVPEPESTADDLRERLGAIHLVHDGMRNPQEIRRAMEIPHRAPLGPTVSGHGGELGHGFYYTSQKKLRRLRWGGRRALARRLERAARGRHGAATEHAYAVYLDECLATLDAGRGHGLRGPNLLDFFYLAQRLPYRSGLGARSARFSACTTPAFVRAAFDLTPAERLTEPLHREVIRRLVPDWSEVGFFISGSAQRPVHRARIWEKPAHAGAISEMVETGSAWREAFDEQRIRAMWAEVSAGGFADYEHVFYRLAWREAFDDHLAVLRRAASAQPEPLTPA